jgi:hypothetical protein
MALLLGAQMRKGVPDSAAPLFEQLGADREIIEP